MKHSNIIPCCPGWWLATVKFLCIPESDACTGLGRRGPCVHWSRSPWSQNTCYYANTQTLATLTHRLSPALSGQESSRRSGHSDTGSMAETPAMSTLVTGDEGAMVSGESGGSSLHWTDYLVIVGYFMSVIVVSSFGMRWNKVSRYFQSSFNVLRSGLCHHSKVKETQWTVIFWQAGAWIGSR